MIDNASHAIMNHLLILQSHASTVEIIQSRDHWKRKAVQRAYEVREQRKSQKRYQEKIAQFKAQIRTMEQTDEDNKKTPLPTAASVVKMAQTRQVRTLCVLLIVRAVVSYRSVPRILTSSILQHRLH